jgi:arsenite methyltransferase
VRSELVARLVDPLDRSPLTLEGDVLRSSTREYPVRDGIPRLVVTEDADQQATGDTFEFKWQRSVSYGSEAMQEVVRAWLVERYGFASAEAMREWFGNRGWILDAGCGAGLATSAWIARGWSAGAEWVGLDISSAIDVARARLGEIERTHFVQADFTHLPFADGAFDTIFAEGTLHHSPSTEAALRSLVRALAPGGEILFYVYRRKAPVRELADEHVRAALAGSSPEQAWDALRPLTRLGQALAELDLEVEVPEDVELLGIRAGRYDVQRLVYWHFAKLYWNPALSLEENTHVNFDWYHPRYAHRHTEDDVRGWCDALGLEIVRFDAQESGFTVRARQASA